MGYSGPAKASFKSEPFTGQAPTVSGMPHPVIIQMQPEIARATGEEVTPSGISRAPQVITSAIKNPLEEKLYKWVSDQLTHSKEQTQEIHKRCAAALAAKNRSSRTVTQSTQQGNLGMKIYDSEAADQVDDSTGLQKDLILQDGKLCKIEYGPSETDARARVLQMAMDDELERGDAEGQTETALHRYVLYPYSGYKAVRNYKRGRQAFYPEAVNPMVIAFSDTGRPCQQQYTIHEAHFYTKREMRWAGFKNVDKLGTADGMGRNSIYPAVDPNNPNISGAASPNATHEVYETWGEPPWQEWLDSGEVTQQHFAQLAADWGFNPRDIQPDSGDLFCIFHKDQQLLKIYPNYLIERWVFPYFISSHYPAENRVAGEAQMERVADMHNFKHVLLNDWADNMRMIGNQAMFYKTSASISKDMLDRALQPRAKIPVAGNDSFEEMFMFFKPENIGADLFQGITYAQSRIKEAGVDDVLRGRARPRTATQSQNDNARQQSTINNAGTRFVRQALKPVLRAIMHMIVANYSGKDWHEVAGEDGAQMILEPFMVDPVQIDKHFQAVPVASFDFNSQSQSINEIVNVVSAFAPMIRPEQGQAAFEEALRLTSLKKHSVDRILNSVGTATDALEEVQTMIDNPWTEPEVIPADDHKAALLVARAAVAANPQLMQQQNFRQWTLKHQLYLFQQMQAEAIQREAMEQAAKSPKGNTKQQPSGGQPTDPESVTRQQAQLSSPADQMQFPGMTGQGAMVG